MFERFARFVVRFRWPVLIVILALTAFFAVAMGDLEVRTDFISSLDADLPVVRLYDYIGEAFGGSDVAVVAVGAADVFQREVLAQLRDFTDTVGQLPEVRSVNSLTEIIDIRPIEGGVEVGDLLPPGELPSQAELDELRDYVLDKEMYTGILVAPSGELTLVLARFAPDIDRVEVGRRIRALAEETFSADVELTYSGLPFQIYYMDQIVLDVLGLLTPLVIGLVALVLGLFYRRLSGVLLPLAGVGFSLVWTMGVMALTGVSISLLTSALPVILFAVGSAYTIHVLSHYLGRRRRGAENGELVSGTLRAVGLPVLLAGLTTIIGFGSLASANIDIISEFGLFAALGVLAATLLAVTFVPAVLAVLGGHFAERRHAGESSEPGRIATGAALFVNNRPRRIAVIALVLGIAAAVALPHVKREVNLLEFFDEDITMRRSERVIEQGFGGSLPAQVYLQGDVRSPSVLRRAERIERFLRAEIGRQTQSLGALLRELNYNLYGERRLPDERAEINDLYYWIEGDELLETFVADGGWWSDGPQRPPNATPQSEMLLFSNVGGSDSDLMVTHTAALEDFIAGEIAPAETRVALADLAEQARRRIDDYRLEVAAEDLLADLTYHGLRPRRLHDQEGEPQPYMVEPAETAEYVEELRSIGVTEADTVDAGYLERLAPFLRTFVYDSGLIPLENEADRLAVVDGLRTTFQVGDPLVPTATELERVFAAVLPPDYLTEYPDDPAWLADKLVTKLNNLAAAQRVDTWSAELEQRLELELDETARADLRAVLYPFTEPAAWLPVELAAEAGLAVDAADTVELRVAQTGFPRIFELMQEQLMTNQLKTMAIAYGLVLILLILVLRSLPGGLLASIPILLTVLVNFAVMALTGIPLDIVTIMIASLVIGIGVDYTIHFTSGFRHNLAEIGDPFNALKATLATTGRAILINAVGVAVGFLVLLFTEIVPLRQLGVMIAVTMVVSSIAALIVLPAVYFALKPRFIFGKTKPGKPAETRDN